MAAALLEINRDSIQVAHKMSLTEELGFINPSFPTWERREVAFAGENESSKAAGFILSDRRRDRQACPLNERNPAKNQARESIRAFP
jgi:hypothetical protein